MTVMRYLFVFCLGVFLMACGPSGSAKEKDDGADGGTTATTDGGGGTDQTDTGGTEGDVDGGTTDSGTTDSGTTDGGTTGGGGTDQCKNEADMAVVGAKNFFKQVEDCGSNCIGGGPNCVGECLATLTGITAGCAGCYDGLFGCIISQCLDQCAGGASAPECGICWQAKCGADFESCSGVPASSGGTDTGTTDEGTTDEGTTDEGTTDGECIPDCQQKICGDDGCDGTCGDCPDGFECSASSQCVGLAGCNGVSYEGCCDAVNVLYCENDELKIIPCSNNDGAAAQCGWDTEQKYYDCGGDPQGDPSGTHPLQCPGEGDGGGSTDGGSTGGTSGGDPQPADTGSGE